MAQSEFFTYKGLPLVRKGKEIYYGNMSDEYVVMIQILEWQQTKAYRQMKELTKQRKRKAFMRLLILPTHGLQDMRRSKRYFLKLKLL